MIDPDYTAWHLHDASIETITINWETKTCQMILNIFMEAGEDAVPCKIIWNNVKNIHIPLQAPWGNSIFVNDHWKNGDNEYVIEMQSGDEIRIEAGSVELIQV